MVIFTKSEINRYSKKDPRVAEALYDWHIITKDANWSNFLEMKKTFNSVDYVGNDLYVFNIKGNRYRLIAKIIFHIRTMYIAFIGTHEEYDRLNLDNL